jgi:predicted XRE-type DNA-binding protein
MCKVTASRGNIFKDIGFKNPEEMLTKAELVFQINTKLDKNELTSNQICNYLNINLNTLTEILRGRLSLISVEDLTSVIKM